jgi:hypothetical protein
MRDGAMFATFEGTGTCPGATCHLHVLLAATGF